ncbi:hypothetical protein [Sphingobacterium siyangense]|nr:hypothetical protein [Sphingobacterium siyangense]
MSGFLSTYFNDNAGLLMYWNHSLMMDPTCATEIGEEDLLTR